MTGQSAAKHIDTAETLPKEAAFRRLGDVTRSLIAGGAMDLFQGDQFIWGAPETAKPGEITVRDYQALTRKVRSAIEDGAPDLAHQNAQRAVASTMLAVQAQAMALDVANQQINLLRLDLLEAEGPEEAGLQDDIVTWQAHAETLRDGLDASRDQLDRLRERTDFDALQLNAH